MGYFGFVSLTNNREDEGRAEARRLLQAGEEYGFFEAKEIALIERALSIETVKVSGSGLITKKGGRIIRIAITVEKEIE